jgi:3-dehydroquinate synthase
MSSILELSVAAAPVRFHDERADFLAILNDRHTYSSLHLVCDEHTVRLCLPRMPELAKTALAPIVIPTGEKFKNLKTCEKVWNALVSQGADRHSIVISLGGGVVTDLGGFCAATYMRGIRFIHIPTSLLGMCDAAIGGKQGVDLGNLKNYVGVFVQPEMIWIDTEFLNTLPDRHLHNGMAEVVKHAIIGDSGLFDRLESLENQNKESVDWEQIIRHAISVKKAFVEADIHEQGVRAALNFGHTIGHAIESLGLANGTQILHGECVALGMILETWISHVHLGIPDRDTCSRIFALVQRWTPVQVQRPIVFDDLIPYLVKDKKVHQRAVHFVLIGGIGKPEVGHPITLDILRKYLKMADLPDQMAWLSP